MNLLGRVAAWPLSFLSCYVCNFVGLIDVDKFMFHSGVQYMMTTMKTRRVRLLECLKSALTSRTYLRYSHNPLHGLFAKLRSATALALLSRGYFLFLAITLRRSGESKPC